MSCRRQQVAPILAPILLRRKLQAKHKIMRLGSRRLPLRLPLFLQEALSETPTYGFHPTFYLYYYIKGGVTPNRTYWHHSVARPSRTLGRGVYILHNCATYAGASAFSDRTKLFAPLFLSSWAILATGHFQKQQ